MEFIKITDERSVEHFVFHIRKNRVAPETAKPVPELWSFQKSEFDNQISHSVIRGGETSSTFGSRIK